MISNYLAAVCWLCLIKLSMELEANYPNLYFTASDVIALRQQAHTTHHAIFARLTQAAEEMKKEPWRYLPPRDWNEYSSKWNEEYGNNFGALAMYCVLNESDLQARHIAIQFFDAFLSLPNWRMKAAMDNDLPVAHSLVAMATAYDFLYEYLDDIRRKEIHGKIGKMSKELHMRSFTTGWGRHYIHNMVATNYVAILTGALVVESNNAEAARWKEKAHHMLNRTMFLLSFVQDGTADEGLYYGLYTSRSLSQYIFLAKRHLGVDLTDNIWLREHFWFIYRTILSGFNETVGIADSIVGWGYGPESQLVFLDNFVMRNGYGNWLGNKIRKSRSRRNGLMGSFQKRYSTLHTEFLFYDPSVLEKEPPNSKTPQLHVFNDWGVVTYGGGTLDNETETTRSTFISFKASVLHGKAVNRIYRTKRYSWLNYNKWRSFNPGHEHPDQGSFVFAPNGVPFITESLYGPKYTWLNNVLLFGPTKKQTCSGSFEGQIGECGRWLDFKNEAIWQAEAKVLTASEVGGIVFISGEMSKWYNSVLGLTSVYRAVILLNPGVLLVTDHIGKTPDSPTRYVGTFFHNRNVPFELRQDPFGQTIGTIVLNGEMYQVLWTDSSGDQSVARCQDAEYPADDRYRKTHFLNITTNLNAEQTRLAYVFVAPGNRVTRPKLDNNANGFHVSVEVNGIPFHVSMVTSYSTSQRRRDFLGFDGFASVRFGNSSSIHFGVDVKGVPKHSLPTIYVSSTDYVFLFIWMSFLLVLLLRKRSRQTMFKCCSRRYLVLIVGILVLINIIPLLRRLAVQGQENT